MVKVFIKGGVWKNSEDEILKAAVMKYGKQNWARVASLLNRKSAKQAKARWHEWLDPSVRKVEWSRQEEEKLLHLAKLMPAQWKTIGPLVGRTAAQCQEHYEQLLDAAAGSEARSTNFQPGQIDSAPETKPARPDPVDMDEDEIEMLQEARARLANTQGKKAKRKAREKLLAQAKRLADLQKRRELKQAGLLSSAARSKTRNKREIDLGVEIPFHKPAPAGFHDTSEESMTAEILRQKRVKSVDFKELNENQFRTRDREALQAKKREEARLQNLERSNMQYAVAAVSKTADPLNTRKRGVLELPAPSVSDLELHKMAKLEFLQQHVTAIIGSSSATEALLGDYSGRPLPTPMRTPVAGVRTNTHESLLNQASQLRALEQAQTPLLSGDFFDSHEAPIAKTNISMESKPNVTPRPSARDEFRLHKVDDDAVSVGGSTFASSTMSIRDMAREERRASKRARKELEDALAALPAPQFEYELSAPIDAGDIDSTLVGTVTDDADHADVDAAERERRRKESEILYAARSSVVRRTDLPRPTSIIPESTVEASSVAELLIQDERLLLLKHDAYAFPMDAGGEKRAKKRNQDNLPMETPLDYIPESALNDAKLAIQIESDQLLSTQLTCAMASGKFAHEHDAIDGLVRATIEVSIQGAKDAVFGMSGLTSALDDKNVVAAMKAEVDALKSATAVLSKKNDRVENRVSVKNGGYAKRALVFLDTILQDFAVLQNLRIEESVFLNLQSHEVRGASMRLEALKVDIGLLEASESHAQTKYGDLLLEKKRLLAMVRKSID